MAGEFSIWKEALLLKLAVDRDTREVSFITFHKNEFLLSPWNIQISLTFSRVANTFPMVQFSVRAILAIFNVCCNFWYTLGSHDSKARAFFTPPQILQVGLS